MDYEFDEGKSKKLRSERGLGFEEIIALIEQNGILKNAPNPGYSGQDIWHVDVDGYVWAVIHKKYDTRIRLITLFPSRKATKQWLKEKDDG